MSFADWGKDKSTRFEIRGSPLVRADIERAFQVIRDRGRAVLPDLCAACGREKCFDVSVCESDLRPLKKREGAP